MLFSVSRVVRFNGVVFYMQNTEDVLLLVAVLCTIFNEC